jgi:hypothetical protein
VPDLQVDADLRLRVTASNGESTTARITGTGQVVRVDVERPDILFASVDNADVGRIADLLAEAGLAVHVEGPDGRAAVIGAGASSRIGKLVTGSSAVSPSLLAAARLVATQPAVRVSALAVLVAAAAVAALSRMRRARP